MKLRTGNVGCSGILAIVAVILLVSWWTNSNLDFWISYFKGHAVHVPYFLSVLLTIVLNGVDLLLNVVASIARYFV
jgi:hypothetical protein